MTQRAFEELIEFASKRLEIIPSARGMNQEKMDQTFYELTKDRGFDLVIDGVLGMQGRAGLEKPLDGWIRLFNQTNQIIVRVSVDMPSGISESLPGETEPFRADFTYCTGIVKTPVLEPFNQPWIGRLRYLDLGFFKSAEKEKYTKHSKVLCSSALPLLRKLRPVPCDKRDFGHLLAIVGIQRTWRCRPHVCPCGFTLRGRLAYLLRAGVFTRLLCFGLSRGHVGAHARDSKWRACP
jgi:hypothetical protein